MSDTPENAGAGAEETGGTGNPAGATVPIEQYRGLQRETGKTIEAQKQTISQLVSEIEKFKGAPSVEDQLEAERAMRAQLENELKLERAKAATPELADVIETFVEKHGIVPDAEVLQTLKTKVASAPAVSESSGSRNRPAQVKTESQKMDEILANGKVFDY